MVEWISGFIVPIIETAFVGGIILFIAYYFYRGIGNAWGKELKFILKYKILKRKYPEDILKWCIDCIDNGIGWYDAKKLLMVNMTPKARLNEILWIYDEIIINLNKEGGKNVGNFKGSYCKAKITAELPAIAKAS